jgi:putative SOS response-associated peptidase YedK
MCGRYTYYEPAKIIKTYGFIKKDDPQTVLALQETDNYNVTPGSTMPVIVRGKQQHIIERMTWGLLPAWSKEPHTALKLINARKEGLFEKPIWKRLLHSHRCIVPARGFYEWQKQGSAKQPFYCTPTNGEVFSFAGLWDEWQGKDGESIKTYTIITTPANDDMKSIHNRMPAILTSKQVALWLSPLELTYDQINDCIHSPQNGLLHSAPVSNAVNNPRNNAINLLYPIDLESA